MNAIETWESGDGVVEFHDGRRVRGRGLLAQVPNGLDPQFGVYGTDAKKGDSVSVMLREQLAL